MKIAVLIIGIDGWKQYTKPLIDSIRENAPDVDIVAVDNASDEPYPAYSTARLIRTRRLCYSAAINLAASQAPDADWLIVLSNDVICTGPFAEIVSVLPDDGIYGPEVLNVWRWKYLMGWCVIVPRKVWNALGGWDEKYIMSSWEDVDYSAMAVEHGFHLYTGPFAFKHLDQRQRFHLPGFDGTHEKNAAYFRSKHVVEQVH